MASVLAMLYLVLFSSLAVGYAATTAMNAQISRNDRDQHLAEAAADGGMQFMRYQLGRMTVPAGTTQTNLLTAVALQLGNQMNGTGNMGTHTVTVANGTIWIPSATGWITLDSASGTQFRASITQSGVNLVTTVTGSGPNLNIRAGVQLQYQQAQKAGAIFNYGIASAGEISMSNSVVVTGATDPTKGSVLSATAGVVPLSNSANGTAFSGDFSWTNPAGVPSYGNISIDGYSSSNVNFSQHVHPGVAAPTFPTVDTSVFLPYCTNTYPNTSGGSGTQNLVNTILQPGNYNFSGTTNIQGVLYIKTPCKVNFSGPVNLQGAIVVENNPQGTLATNSISFTQQVTVTGMETLPANSTFPDGERALTGSVILAPDFAVSASNTFGAVAGSMVAGQFTFTNNFTATIDGSIVQLNDTPMKFTNTANVTVASVGTSYFPAGVTFGTIYTPLQGTYVEVTPQ